MYCNIKIALAQKGITLKQFAEFLGVGDKTIQNKIYGKTDFTYTEFKKICALLSEYNADYLFADKAG